MSTFRESSILVIETGRTTIRAGLGIHELLKTPTVVSMSLLRDFMTSNVAGSQEIPARVGLRQGAGEPSNNIDSNGKQPSNTLDSLRPSPPPSRASSLPHHPNPAAKVNDYLVGTQLDEALAAGQDVSVSWPFADGNIRDWTQAEALWYVLYIGRCDSFPTCTVRRKYVIFNQLQIKRVQNESPVILSTASGLSRDSLERTCQIFFERFNVAGFTVVERAMTQIYAAGQLSGVVVDIGYETTDITPIYDGFILQNIRTSTPIGIRDCERYLANIFRSNQSVMAAASPPESQSDPETIQQFLVDFVQRVWQDGLVRVPSDGQTVEIPEDEGVTDIAAVLVAGKEKAVIETGMKKKATAKASAAEQARAREIEALDLVTVEFRGHSITVGKERHRFCEPLFDPTLLKPQQTPIDDVDPLPLQDAVGLSVGQAEVDQRQYMWQALFVTGDLGNHVKGMCLQP